jgi:hypothetical protein
MSDSEPEDPLLNRLRALALDASLSDGWEDTEADILLAVEIIKNLTAFNLASLEKDKTHREELERYIKMIKDLEEQINKKDEALDWYDEHGAGCRKLGSVGDPFRHALDADGGKRAREARMC